MPDLDIEGFVEALWSSWDRVWFDLGIEGFVEELRGSLYRICLDLGVEGFVVPHLHRFGHRGVH